MIRLPVVLSLTALSCASLPLIAKDRMRAQGELLLVRAPPPLMMVPNYRADELRQAAASLLRHADSTQTNVTSVHGGRDPSEVLSEATLRRLEFLGYRPATAKVQVRFDNPPSRWPPESGVSANWVLHTQIDRIGYGTRHLVTRMRASATLFNELGVELRLRCEVEAEPAPDAETALLAAAARAVRSDAVIPGSS